MKNLLNHRLTIPVFLCLLFIAPALAAIFLYQHPNLMPAQTSNRGQLLRTPVKMVSLGGASKWKLLYWGNARCGQDCLQQLDKLARVRLSLGRHFYELEEWLLLDSGATMPREQWTAEMAKQGIGVHRLSADKTPAQLREVLGTSPQIFIVSPDLDLVLSYPVTGSPDDIYKDLKHLLALAGQPSGRSHVS